ncbi:hypothetical protein K2X05_03540 [bacterium]|nr:hypothetical protein [bacterium]
MKYFLVFALALPCFTFAYDDQDGENIRSCKDAIELANRKCARYDDPEYGDGDDYFDLDCVDSLMGKYGYEYWKDYRTESKGEARPGYNEFVCNSSYNYSN